MPTCIPGCSHLQGRGNKLQPIAQKPITTCFSRAWSPVRLGPPHPHMEPLSLV